MKAYTPPTGIKRWWRDFGFWVDDNFARAVFWGMALFGLASIFLVLTARPTPSLSESDYRKAMLAEEKAQTKLLGRAAVAQERQAHVLEQTIKGLRP